MERLMNACVADLGKMLKMESSDFDIKINVTKALTDSLGGAMKLISCSVVTIAGGPLGVVHHGSRPTTISGTILVCY